MPPTVVVTGATGFVGRHVCAELVRRGARVRALVRSGSPHAHAVPRGAETVRGDIADPLELSNALAGADVVVHLVGIVVETPRGSFAGIHTEGTRNVVSAMSERKIRRLVHMSALGTRSGIDTDYFRTKSDAEEIVMRSGLTSTVFRPAIIHGPDGAFTRMIAGMVCSPFPVPVLGDGTYRLQPVYVEDVARVFADAALDGVGAGEAFEIGGPESYTYDGLLDAFGLALRGQRPAKVHVPLALARMGARVLEAVLPVPPVTCDQITMLLAGNTCDTTPLITRFGVTLTPLGRALEAYGGELTGRRPAEE